MRILAIDMGRSKSVACDYVAQTAEHVFQTVQTDPAAFHDLLVARQAEVVVIEICPAAGWVKDLCDALGQKLIVANTSDEPWRWRKTKVKTDRKDALKLAKLQAMNQISAVHIPLTSGSSVAFADSVSPEPHRRWHVDAQPDPGHPGPSGEAAASGG